MDTIKYLIYARKSSESEDRQVLSIDSQKKELLDLTKKQGIKVEEIKEEAHSAKAPGRPIYNQLLDDIEKGRAQGIIVWNPDRLSRNSVDTGRLIYLFDIGKLQELVTPSQTFRNTPNDKFLLSLLCSQAKLDNDNKGINVKRGLRAKCERGIYPAPAPTGYLNNKYADRGNKTIVPDPERFEMVKKMFELILSRKYTPMQVFEMLNNEWKFKLISGKKLSHSAFYYILNNPFYSGEFEYPKGSGNWYQGMHKKIIEPNEFDDIQILLGKKGRPRPRTHVFAFSGSLMRCGVCKGSITCEEKIKKQKNGNIHKYIYYHCSKKVNPDCTQGCIEEKELTKQILRALGRLKIPSEFHDWALKWFRKQNENEAKDRGAILVSQQKAYKECSEKIDNLIDMRAGKEISPEEFSERRQKLLTEKRQLEELLTDTGRRAENWLDKAQEVFDFARDAVKKFNEGGLEEKREVFSRLGSNLIIKDKILAVDLEETLIPMETVSKEVNEIHERFEPVENADRIGQLENLYLQNPVMLPG